MNYEEKYKEAIERASKLKVQNPFDTVSQMMEHIFPEFKESEDEKVRNGIIKFLIDVNNGAYTKSELEIASWISWLKKQGESDKSLYIRFGDIPTNGKSKVYNGEIEIGIEEGISVYPAFEDKEDNIILGLNLPITKTSLHTQQHLLEYDNRPCYLVTGDYVGKGTDGEPLIKNVRIIKEIKPYRVKEDKENNTYVINNTPNCGISVYNEELKKSEDERIRKELISFVNNDGWKFTKLTKEEKESWIAWLEKQGDKKHTIRRFKIGDKVHCGDESQPITITGIRNDAYLTNSVIGPILFSDEDNWKLVEQKTVKWSEEDERIRKWLIGYFEQYKVDGMEEYSNGLKVDNILAWLEKPGEKEQDPCEHCNDKCLNCHNFPCVDKREFERGKSAMEAIKEENVDNANKVEPKFHEGDWAVSNLDKKARQISEVHFDEYNSYYVVDGKSVNLEEYDRLHHLWTIQDAKDGDVLYSLDSNQPFIYKDRKPYEQATAYCGINKYGKFFVWRDQYCIITLYKYIPATQEQRDLLFQKMKEASYKWNAEKKELINIKVKQ